MIFNQQINLWIAVLLLISSTAKAQISQQLNSLLLNKSLPIQIPFSDEESAKTLLFNHSTYYKDISQQWTLKHINDKISSVNKKSAQPSHAIFYTRLQTPAEWQLKETFLLFTCPKMNMEVWLNGEKIASTIKDVSVSIKLTSSLAKENMLEVKTKSKVKLSSLQDLVHQVSIIATPAVHINYLYNYFTWDGIHPRSGYYGAGFWQLIKNYADPSWNMSKYKHIIRVYDQSGKLQRQVDFLEPKGKNHEKESITITTFHDAHFQRWTAETPDLHIVTLQNLSPDNEVTEVLGEQTGFRFIRIKDKQLQVNNVPVQLKAVHFSMPATCDCNTNNDSIRQVLKTIKQHNINTLILSDYQPTDELYKLCDEFGLYVIQRIDFSASTMELYSLKVMAMVNLLKNHPSLLAWHTEPKPEQNLHYQALKDTIGFFDIQRPVLPAANTPIENFIPDMNKIPQWHQLENKQLSALKKQYQYVDFWVKHHAENTVQLTNRYDFISLKNMTLQWQILSADSTLQQGEISDFDAAPGKTQPVQLPFSFMQYRDKVFRFTLRLKHKTSWAEAHQEIAFEKFKFSSINNDLVLIKDSE